MRIDLPIIAALYVLALLAMWIVVHAEDIRFFWDVFTRVKQSEEQA